MVTFGRRSGPVCMWGCVCVGEQVEDMQPGAMNSNRLVPQGCSCTHPLNYTHMHTHTNLTEPSQNPRCKMGIWQGFIQTKQKGKGNATKYDLDFLRLSNSEIV